MKIKNRFCCKLVLSWVSLPLSRCTTTSEMGFLENLAAFMFWRKTKSSTKAINNQLVKKTTRKLENKKGGFLIKNLLKSGLAKRSNRYSL